MLRYEATGSPCLSLFFQHRLVTTTVIRRKWFLIMFLSVEIIFLPQICNKLTDACKDFRKKQHKPTEQGNSTLISSSEYSAALFRWGCLPWKATWGRGSSQLFLMFSSSISLLKLILFSWYIYRNTQVLFPYPLLSSCVLSSLVFSFLSLSLSLSLSHTHTHKWSAVCVV